MKRNLLSIMVLATALLPVTATAAMVTLSSISDNTLYEDDTGVLSNGSGPGMFAGRIGMRGLGKFRRALVKFDIAGNIPAGSMITSVALTLTVTKVPPVVPTASMTLHEVSADWGEGTSNAGLDVDGMGAAAVNGDATWIHAFWPATTWASPGGDFSSTVSAALAVTGIGPYTWLSTTQLVEDVQGWLDTPASNFGWLLKGDEFTMGTSKRFGTREHATPDNRPSLTIEYDDMTPTVATTWGAIKGLYR